MEEYTQKWKNTHRDIIIHIYFEVYTERSQYTHCDCSIHIEMEQYRDVIVNSAFVEWG